jgi:hypothetical protein
MARNHYITPTVPAPVAQVVRLGAGNSDSDNLSDVDEGKIVKLVGESRYGLAVAGDEIEAVIVSVEPATSNGFSIGGISKGEPSKPMYAVADGLEATPGTGVIAVGDYVVAGSITAKGTALTSFPKVCKATDQGTQKFLWRVVSLGTAGTGAVGTRIVIERV